MMLSAVVGRACSSGVGSRITLLLHSMGPMTACRFHMFHKAICVPRSLKSKMPWKSVSPLVRLQVLASATQVPVQKQHSTGSTDPVLRPKGNEGPTQTHVFRIKSNQPSGPKVDGPFSFFSPLSLFSTPAPFMLYGLGGLIPFMSAPAYLYLSGDFNPAVAHAQLMYGACILSFLGGVSWGDHLHRSEKASLRSLCYSILLPLVAWPALLLYPNPASFLLMIAGIIYAGVKDTRSAASYPRWFKNLRFLLSSLVALSLSATLLLQFTLNGEDSGEVHNDKES